MALISLKISQMLTMRSISTSPRFDHPPVARSCSCPEEPPKKGVLQFPFGKKSGNSPCPAKPSKLKKLCMFGAKSGIAGGLVYWTYQQGLWTDSESSEALLDRLKSAGNALLYGSCTHNSAMATNCCEYGKDENEVIQRLKTAYCFLKLDSANKPSIVEDAVYVGTLGDDDDFCHCDICKPVMFFRDTASATGSELKPSDKTAAASPAADECEEPTRGEWIWNKWSSQNWSPKTCIFSKQCACGDKTEGAAPATVTEEETPQEEDNNYYVDEYFIIRKEEGEEEKEKEKEKEEQDGGGNAGGEGASEGAGDGGAGEDEAAGEEEAGEEEAADEEEAAEEEAAEEEA